MNEILSSGNSFSEGAIIPVTMVKKLLIVVAALGLISGCVVHPGHKFTGEDRSRLLAEILGEQAAPTELITLQLSDEIRAELDAQIDPRWRSKRKLRELRSYLFNENELNIEYDASSSLTANQTYELRRGNCLALTNLFIAAGRHVGIDANYQTVAVDPTWNHSGETMIRYEHIVAVGDIGEENYIVDFLPEFLIGDKPAEEITDEQALALYFNNLGAEAVVDERPLDGVGFLRKALALDPTNSDAWNNMGAALRRSGQERLAEFAYLQSLEHNAYNYSALSNLSRHYENSGRSAEAEVMSARVDRYRRRNPYFHYFAAQVMFDDGYYQESLVFLGKAIRLKRDQPEFLEAAARVHAKLGNEVEQQRFLRRAKDVRERKVRIPPERIMQSRMLVQKTNVTARIRP